eukprot:TRINITY_DN6651_c0_g1_i1.p1 TRINITY_DN6651_c0_g1~~TRINITY_DN6651_c0_g1_i1.p1  ORF type:complete len:408 (+),score=14.08 TRINITY_DN6651_c0_g1_i1:240-1463(+)
MVTKGGSYKYSVRLLETDGKLPIQPVYKVELGFKVLVELPIEPERVCIRLAYRAIGSDEWQIVPSFGLSTYTTKSTFPLQVDPYMSYEAKIQLYIDDFFETEYSPPCIIEDHKMWINQFFPDDFFLDNALQFVVSFYYWPPQKDIILKVKLEETEDWISFEKLYSHGMDEYSFDPTIFYLNDRLYDQLLDSDNLVEWKLVFRDQITKQEHESEVNYQLLKKREKFQGYELMTKSYTFQADSNESSTKIYLCRNGVFKMEDSYRELLNFSGRFRLKSSSQDSSVLEMIFVPQLYQSEKSMTPLDRMVDEYHNKNRKKYSMDINSDSYHPIWSLPDLATIIFKDVLSLNEDNEDDYPLETLISINLVCKQWYKTFVQSFELHGSWDLDIKLLGWKQKENNGRFNQLCEL